MKFWCKVHRAKGEIILAICDENLLERKLKFGEVELIISKEFYGEKKIEEKEAVKMMKEATIINLFGEEIVKLAIKYGFISKENVMLIEGVPHAQAIKF